MRLKYQDEIDNLQPCFIDFDEPNNKSAYRFVFNDLADIRNHKPVYHSNPDRVRDTFRGWALSCFDTQAQAKARLLYFTSGKPNAYKKLGTHLAVTTLTANDGLCEKQSNNLGHFDHFEYEGVDWAGRFTLVEEVIKIAS